VTVQEAKTQLSSILRRLEALAKSGDLPKRKAFADLVLHHPDSRISVHPLLRQIKTACDPTEPMSDKE
jgi:hypothetical protein